MAASGGPLLTVWGSRRSTSRSSIATPMLSNANRRTCAGVELAGVVRIIDELVGIVADGELPYERRAPTVAAR